MNNTSKNMNYVINEIQGKKYITFPKLSALGLNNVFSTSDMDFRLRESQGKVVNKDKLASDYKLLKTALQSYNKTMFSSNQVHDCNIIAVNSLELGEPYAYGRTLPPVDGLITNKTDIILKTTYADCTPLLIFDPVTKSQASLHSGWRGTTKKIGTLGVALLEKEYQAKPENMIAVIGPAIGETSFEVEKDVVDIFRSTFDFWKEVVKQKSETKYLINIKETNKKILEDSGIKPENIIICPLDTYNNSLFHSHRYEGAEKAGRMVMLSTIM